MKKIIVVILAVLLVQCAGKKDPDQNLSKAEDGSVPAITERSKSLPLDSLKLPPGFTIAIFAEVNDARSLAISPTGTIFVGNRDGDKIYAIKDTDGDFKADKKWVIDSGLNRPNGVAFKDGNLYVAEVSRILKYQNIEATLSSPADPIIINDTYPTEDHHGWKYIAFGPDGKLYVPVGAPCNICESKDSIFNTITRIQEDGSGREIYAKGIRNTVGFTWHPVTKELWFTDNGRDLMGDDVPPCELNLAPQKGLHFGYPYCHAGTIKDSEFGDKHACKEFVAPVQSLGPHVAPLGVKFYTGSMFPEAYKNQAFIAEHGSWNRSKKIGYRISLVKIKDNKASAGYETFVSGWLDENEGKEGKAWGRPVDVLLLPDGSLLVSDDMAGVIYRISYKG